MEAGLNVRTNFTPPQTFILPLRELVKEGSLSMATLDKRVSEVLRVKFRLGLFDQPYVKDPKAADEVLKPGRTTPFMLKMARESLVLLKNDSSLLPLEKKKYRRILVVGPLAKATSYAISRYGPSHLSVVSVEEGLRNFVGNAAVLDYAQGCEVADSSWPEGGSSLRHLPHGTGCRIEEAAAKARRVRSDRRRARRRRKKGRRGHVNAGLGLPGPPRTTFGGATGDQAATWSSYLVNGQPLTINWANRYIPAILEAWFPNQLGGQAIAETLFGDNNPGSKLKNAFPKTTGEIEWQLSYKPGERRGGISTTQSGRDGWGADRDGGRPTGMDGGRPGMDGAQGKGASRRTRQRFSVRSILSVVASATRPSATATWSSHQKHKNRLVMSRSPWISLGPGVKRR